MVGVKSFVVVLLIGAAVVLQSVDALEWMNYDESSAAYPESMEPLPTLEEYIQAKRNKEKRSTNRAFTQPPYIGSFYRFNSAVINRTAVNCHILQVGVHALLASNGQEYRRHEVAELDCLNIGSINLQKKNFFQCADAAATSRYNSFTFTAGVCKAYPIWRHRKLATCSNSAFVGGTGTILYIATTQLVKYTSTALTRFPLVFNSIFHGVGRILLQWTAPDKCSVVAKYKIITVSGTEELRGGLGSYYYTTFNKALCDNNVTVSNKTVTVVGYDYDDVEVLRLNSTPKTTGSKRYALSDGSCVLYDPSVALDLVSSTKFCKGMYAILPTASPAMPFSSYKQMIAAVREPVEDHFTGAMLTSALVWEWSELCQPVNSTEWDLKKSPTNFTLGTCSTSSRSDGYVLLQEECDAHQSVVCHDAAWRVVDYDPSGLN